MVYTPTPLTDTDDLILLRMKIGDSAGGWLEDYILGPLTYAEALPVAAEGCWWRTAWFGSDVSLWGASISHIQPPNGPGGPRNRPDRKAISGIDFPYNPHVAPFPWTSLGQQQGVGSGSGDVSWSGTGLSDENDPFVGPMWQRETPDGAWVRLILRGLPDNYTQGMRWKGTGTLTAPSDVPTPYLTGAAPNYAPGTGSQPNAGTIYDQPLVNYQNEFLTWILAKTFYHTTNRGQYGPTFTGAWLYESFDRLPFEGIRKLNLGKSWGQFRGRALTGK